MEPGKGLEPPTCSLRMSRTTNCANLACMTGNKVYQNTLPPVNGEFNFFDNVAKPGMKSLTPRLFLPRLGRFAAPDYPSRRAFRCESRAAGEILIYARTRPLRGSRLRVRSPGLLRQIARICHSGRIRLSPEAARSRSRSPCVRSRRLHPRSSPRYFLAGYRFVVSLASERRGPQNRTDPIRSTRHVRPG